MKRWLKYWHSVEAWCVESLQKKRPEAVLFSAVFLFGLISRTLLGCALFTRDITPMNFVANRFSLMQGLGYFIWDFFFALVLATFAYGLRRLLTRETHTLGLRERVLIGLGWAVIFVSLLVIGLITGAHYDMVLETHSGLSFDVVAEGWSAGSVADVFGYSSLRAVAVALLPVTLALGLLLTKPSSTLVFTRVLGALVSLTVALQIPTLVLLTLHRLPATPNFALRSVPAYFTTLSISEAVLIPPSKLETRRRALDTPRPEAITLDGVEWLLEKPDPAPIARVSEASEAWNIVFFVLESTGARYVFGPALDGGVVMPFLQRLKEEGTYLERHYSTANTSPRAIFSLMSGLYPAPQLNLFCTRADVVVPGLGHFLGARYEKFLVTPGRLQSYFPLAFFREMGVSRLYDFYSLPETEREPFVGARHEADAVDHFISLVEGVKEPFFGTYYSYAPHYNYNDYGPKYRVSSGATKLDAYLSNLRMLDTQLERMVRAVEKRGAAARTVFVFVGDHGEAFGQHEDNWTHARASFEENLRVPVLLYQPRIFPSSKVKGLTSHVDLLPTLLDALHIGFQPAAFQGESLFRPQAARYRFVYGNEQMASSLDREGYKLQVSLKDDLCRTFDLGADPFELHPESCGTRPAQLDQLLRFISHQRVALPRYNNSLKPSTARPPHRTVGL